MAGENLVSFTEYKEISNITNILNTKSNFNYKKKAVSYFLIYTKNLNLIDFNISTEKIDLYIKTNGGIYGELLSYLQEHDEEFKLFEKNILGFLKNDSNFTEIEKRDISNLRKIMKTHTNYNTVDLITNFQQKSEDKTFQKINAWKKTKFRNAWDTFKKSSESKLAKVKLNELEISSGDKQKNQYLINNNNNINILDKNGNLVTKTDGAIISYSDDLISTSDLGTKNDRTVKTEYILFKCLMSDNPDTIPSCLMHLNRSINENGSIDNKNLLNPHLVLSLLHRLGFKSKDNKIVNVKSWRDNILNKISTKPENILDDGKKLTNYLQNLIDYINSYDLKLLLNKPDLKKLYDPSSNTNYYGKDIKKDLAANPTNYIPLAGLAHFYESHKSYGKTTTDFINYLYGYYGFDLPQNIRQQGGANLVNSISDGVMSHKNLKEMFNSLIKSTQKIKLHDNDVQKVNQLLGLLENIENQLVQYIKFMNEVYEVDKIFKDFIPENKELKTEDTDNTTEKRLTKLRQQFKLINEEYTEKRDIMTKLISSLADMEQNPEQKSSKYDAFDL